MQKAGALSSAAALLRRRLPPFEEMQLDGEVATYAHDPPSFCSLQRRCGDPVASYLHWQDYTVSLRIDSRVVMFTISICKLDRHYVKSLECGLEPSYG